MYSDPEHDHYLGSKPGLFPVMKPLLHAADR
jgi:hypothetical protein